MLEQDYLMRAIVQLREALVRIMKKKDERDLDGALEAVGDASNHLVGVPTGQLVLFPLETILEMVSSQGEVESPRAAAVARLLVEHGRLLEGLGRGDGGKAFFIKAFCLYDEISEEAPEPVLDEHRETIGWLLDRLG